MFVGIRGEDAGLIGCHSLTDEQNIAVVNLTVRGKFEDKIE